MPTKMLIETTSGLHETRTHNLVSTDPKEIVAFLKKGGTTGGFSISFAVNPATGEVFELFKKGHLIQKEVKVLLERGFREFLFSWAFAGKTFQLENGQTVKCAGTIDLAKWKDIQPYAKAFGY